MLVLGEGKNPGTTELQALGKKYGLKNAPDILARVQKAVTNWSCYAERAEVSAKSAKDITNKLKLR